MYTCGNLASPSPDPIWGGEANPKVMILVESSSPTQAPGGNGARAPPPYPLDTFGKMYTRTFSHFSNYVVRFNNSRPKA